MNVSINYISNGKWHIRKRSDLYAVYRLVIQFVERCMPEWLEGVSRFKFDYDRELDLVSLTKCISNSSVSLLKDAKVVSLKDDSTEFSAQVRLLLDTIGAMGIVSAPFNSVNLLLDTSMLGEEDLNPSDYLVSSGCKGRNKGYYTLQGKLV